nr:TetR/AcrR family transcriptional regulator [Bifidobacterium simiarum]
MTADERQRQILQEATTIIGRQGFWGFTVRQVAEACGLTEPAVLYHFKNKESLMVAVLVRRDDVDLSSLAANLGIDQDDLWKDPVSFGLRELCEALVAGNVNQPEIVRLYTVMQAESLNAAHPAHEYFNNREQWATGLFTRAAIHDGYDEPERVAKIFFSEMDGLQLRWLRDLEHFDLMKEWRLFVDRFRE